MSDTDRRGSVFAEYLEGFGFIFVAVVVAWLLAKEQVPFQAVPMVLKAAVLSVIPFVFTKLLGTVIGRIVMAVVVIAYLDHELHFIT